MDELVVDEFVEGTDSGSLDAPDDIYDSLVDVVAGELGEHLLAFRRVEDIEIHDCFWDTCSEAVDDLAMAAIDVLRRMAGMGMDVVVAGANLGLSKEIVAKIVPAIRPYLAQVAENPDQRRAALCALMAHYNPVANPEVTEQ